jgi:addiction module RelE/StbE family toxin
MNVYWTQNAKRELRAIHDYIAQNSPRYAQGMVDRITSKSEQLQRFPLFGAEVTEYGDPAIRELLEYPYRIIYKVRADRIEVLSVVHGARLLPPLGE